MKTEEKASISIMKIICISIILILISGIGVMAVNTKLNDIKIMARLKVSLFLYVNDVYYSKRLYLSISDK